MNVFTLEEKSAGGVVFRRVNGSIDFLIGMHSGYGKWVLPKGLVEHGETDTDAAVREVEEEVGVKAAIVGISPIKTIDYWYSADFSSQTGVSATGEKSERRVKKYQEEGAGKTRVHKTVVFYLMELLEDLGKEGWEMSERRWVSYDEGKKLLAFDTEKEAYTAAWESLSASGQN